MRAPLGTGFHVSGEGGSSGGGDVFFFSDEEQEPRTTIGSGAAADTLVGVDAAPLLRRSEPTICSATCPRAARSSSWWSLSDKWSRNCFCPCEAGKTLAISFEGEIGEVGWLLECGGEQS